VVAALDKLCGGLLLAATAGGSEFALSLFDAKGELFRLSNDLITGLADRMRGLSRYDRTRRLEAANAIAVRVAFFECVSQIGLPRELLPSKTEQLSLAAERFPRFLLHLSVPTSQPHEHGRYAVDTTEAFYEEMAREIRKFLSGLAGWQALPHSSRAPILADLDQVPARAAAKYEELFRQLAVEFPEFGYWATMLDHEATRAEVRHLNVALEGLAESLERIRVGRDASGVRLDLAKSYQAGLRRPGVAFGDLRVPAIERCYVNPNFRVAVAQSDQITQPDWWRDQPSRADLQDFLVGYLTSTIAVNAPLLVLGHPGAGKSLLTETLAARLPANDFLAVRVPLRDLPSDADLQTQIEMAIRSATGRTITWPELAAEAGDALPVVLLDGFDELLQATGQGQSNYG
jgi:hypothetical protein